MKWEKFTPAAQEAIAAAQNLARRRDHGEIELEHLTDGLLRLPDGLCALMVAGAGVSVATLLRALEETLVTFPRVIGGQVFLGPEALAALDAALREARKSNEERVGPEHILLAIPQDPRSPVSRLLRSLGASRDRLAAEVGPARARVARGERPTPLPPPAAPAPAEQPVAFAPPPSTPAAAPAAPPPAGLAAAAAAAPSAGTAAPAASNLTAEAAAALKEGDHPVRFPMLEKYGRDLTRMAALNKLDPVVGRDAEMRRVMQVLSRRSKNNPVVIGEPGVGKTAVVEGIAQRIVAGDVPGPLKGRRLVALDLGALLAGAKFRGEFEDRIKSVLREIAEGAGEVVLFIDELHTLVGAGGADGSIDAAGLLKPALARGELRCIGATTLSEYRKHVEKDAALARRFQPVLVPEPTDDEAIAMLRGLKDRYELYHGVRISDAALCEAVKLARRYISDRYLPDKALDLIDEAASQLRIEVDSFPTEVDELDRRARGLDIERRALMTEVDSDPSAVRRRELIEKELISTRSRFEQMKVAWRQERADLEQILGIKKELEAARRSEEEAIRVGDLGAAAELTHGKIPGLQKRLEDARVKMEQPSRQGLLHERVLPEHVAEVVAAWTGIPVSKMLEEERQKLLQMEKRLGGRVLGQDRAVELVSRAVRRARVGLADPGKPIGSFLFLGPTGVGKTELTRALAEFLFDDPQAMIRMDMSEFMEKHAAQRLVGAPPGYIGYEEGGQLTEAVRRRPYAVVLFDEVEKAHGDVFNMLLQVLDDGRLTDGQGRTVDFKNVVVVMTSNIGSSLILDLSAPEQRTERQARIQEALRAQFRPEFINRIDEVIIFEPLGPAEIERIVDLQLARVQRLLREKSLGLELLPEAKQVLAHEGYVPGFGARPLKRAVQRLVQDPLAEELLNQRFAAGDTIVAGVKTREPAVLAFSRKADGASAPTGASS
jgi:ATP-dependent Clp protease ATP-binding subunit ClpB